MAQKAKTQAAKRSPVQRALGLLPFGDVPPVLVNYWIYTLTLLALAVALVANRLPVWQLLVHILLSVPLLILSNYLVRCVLLGSCLPAAFGIISLVQAANIALIVMSIT